MAFEDVARSLAQIATGWQQGTTEREQADRTEQQRLTEQAIQHGSRGEDYATFFVDENFRPGTADTLHRLQQASGPVGPGVSGEGMLQYPFAARINLQAEREDAQRTANEVAWAERERAADERLRATQDQQLARDQARLTAQQNRQRTTLNPNEWDEMRVVMQTVTDNQLAGQIPDYFVPNPRGGVMPNPIYADARARILRSMENRLPMQLPMDMRSLGNIMTGIYNDLAPGIRVTPRGGGFLGSGYFAAPGTLTFNEAAAAPVRPDSPAPGGGTAGTPPGTITIPEGGIAPTGQPGQVGQRQVGRPSVREEALAQATLQRYAGPIDAAAREFNLPRELLASVFGPGEGGQMVQGPVIRGRAERAFGIAQVLPSTYNQVARELREGRPITDPGGNARVGTAYLATQMRDFNGDLMLALAAYNWGPQNLRTMMNRYPEGISRQTLFAQLPRETQGYIERIGAGLGGWDGPDKNSIPRLAGNQGTQTTQPQGTPTGNVTQRGPTPQEAGPTAQYIASTVGTISRRIMTTTNFTQRPIIRDRMLADLPDVVRRRFSPALVDHIVSEVRRQVQGIG
jgi:hypothetical protein